MGRALSLPNPQKVGISESDRHALLHASRRTIQPCLPRLRRFRRPDTHGDKSAKPRPPQRSPFSSPKWLSPKPTSPFGPAPPSRYPKTTCPPYPSPDRKSTRLNSSHLVISYA